MSYDTWPPPWYEPLLERARVRATGEYGPHTSTDETCYNCHVRDRRHGELCTVCDELTPRDRFKLPIRRGAVITYSVKGGSHHDVYDAVVEVAVRNPDRDWYEPGYVIATKRDGTRVRIFHTDRITVLPHVTLDPDGVARVDGRPVR